MMLLDRREQHGTRSGLTLLEVLAAIVVLGMIVVTVTPLFLRVGGQTLRLESRIAAEALLTTELSGVWVTTLPPNAGMRSVAGHPGWEIAWTPLISVEGVSTSSAFSSSSNSPSSSSSSNTSNSGAGSLPMQAHRWIHFRLQGPTSDLWAERVIPLKVP